MFKTLLRAAALIATLALTGCVSYSVTGPLGAPPQMIAEAT